MEASGVTGFLEWCKQHLEPADWITDPSITSGYCADWTGRLVGHTGLVLRPDTAAKVREIIVAALEWDIRLCVQGGNTSLAGGSVPLAGEVVLSTRRLNKIRSLDPDSQIAVVEAGVTLSELKGYAARFGLDFGVDIAPRDSATLGGMAATNAGGLHVIRYGPMRTQVVGVQVAYGDGSALTPVSELVKDNTGFSEESIFVGSEGTLGVVTALALKLIRAESSKAVTMIGVSSATEAKRLAGAARKAESNISAIELLDDISIKLVEAEVGAEFPLKPHPKMAVLIEVASSGSAESEVIDILDALQPNFDVTTAVVSTGTTTANDIWRWRESIPSAIRRVGEALKLDLSVPISRLDVLFDRLTTLAKEYGDSLLMVRFGHLGDGNLHMNLVGEDTVLATAEAEIYQMVAELGGAITAEHGVGTLKKAYLGLVRTPTEVDRYRRLILVFNPRRVTNPNVMV